MTATRGGLLRLPDQLRADVEVPAQHLQRQPPGDSEEASSCGLLAEQLDGAHAPVHPVQVEHLPRDREPPELRLEARVRIAQVRGRVVEPDRPVPTPGELVRSPVRGQRRIERVGDEQRVVQAVREVERLERERPGPDRLLGVGPAARQRRREPGARRRLGRGVVRRVQPDRQQPGRQVVDLAAGQPEHGCDAGVEVAVGLGQVGGPAEEGHGGLAVAAGPGLLGPGQQ